MAYLAVRHRLQTLLQLLLPEDCLGELRRLHRLEVSLAEQTMHHLHQHQQPLHLEACLEALAALLVQPRHQVVCLEALILHLLSLLVVVCLVVVVVARRQVVLSLVPRAVVLSRKARLRQPRHLRLVYLRILETLCSEIKLEQLPLQPHRARLQQLLLQHLPSPCFLYHRLPQQDFPRLIPSLHLQLECLLAGSLAAQRNQPPHLHPPLRLQLLPGFLEALNLEPGLLQVACLVISPQLHLEHLQADSLEVRLAVVLRLLQQRLDQLRIPQDLRAHYSGRNRQQQLLQLQRLPAVACSVVLLRVPLPRLRRLPQALVRLGECLETSRQLPLPHQQHQPLLQLLAVYLEVIKLPQLLQQRNLPHLCSVAGPPHQRPPNPHQPAQRQQHPLLQQEACLVENLQQMQVTKTTPVKKRLSLRPKTVPQMLSVLPQQAQLHRWLDLRTRPWKILSPDGLRT